MYLTLGALLLLGLAGQLVSAALGYAALRALGEQHIKDCVRVSATLALAPPEPHARA